MKRVEFARLAGISPPMVTKYAEGGFIRFRADDDVDALASLVALEGRLDEEKRQAALAEIAKTPAAAAAPIAAPAPRSAKAEHDAIKRDMLELEYKRRAGELVPIADVERQAGEAVAAMRAAFELEVRQVAQQIVIDLGVSTDRSAAMTRTLRGAFNDALQRFADAMRQPAEPLEGAEPIAAE